MFRGLRLSERSLEDVGVVGEWLQKIKFVEHLPFSILCEIASHLRTRVFLSEEFLCRKGDIGNCAYILYKGTVGVYTDGNKIVNYEDKEMFGTQALNNNIERSADLRAEKKSIVLLLFLNDYKFIMGNYIKEQISNTAQWLMDQSICAKMTQGSVKAFCSAMSSKYYEKGERIIVREEEANNIFIIRKGSLSGSFWFSRDFVNQWPTGARQSYSKKVLTKEFEVQTIVSSGECLGIFEALTNTSKYLGSFVTNEKSLLLGITKQHFLRLFSDPVQREHLFGDYVRKNKEKMESLEEQVQTEIKNSQKYVRIRRESELRVSLNEGKQKRIVGKSSLEMKPTKAQTSTNLFGLTKNIKKTRIISQVRFIQRTCG